MAELSDEQVFGAQTQPQKELSDAEVFASSPQPTPTQTFAAGSPREIARQQAAGSEIAQGVIQGAKELVPRSIPSLAKMLFYTPVEEVPHSLKMASDLIRGVPVEQSVPESQTLVGFSQKPPREQARIATGIGAEALMGVGAAFGLRAPGLHETLFSEEAASKEVINNATQEGVVKEDNIVQHPGDGEGGTPAETGGSGGVKPSPQAPQEKIATAPEAFPSLLQSSEDARRAELRQEPAPVSEPTETTTDQPLTQEKGGEVGEKVQVQREDEGKRKEGILTPEAATVQPPAAPEQQSITAIKNEQVDRERASRGLPSVIEPARKSFGESWDKATAKIDKDPNYPTDLVKELKSKPRALTDEEDATLLHHQIDLQNQFDKASAEVNTARESGNEASAVENRVRMSNLSDQLLDVYNVGKESGTETGRGLAARKMMAAEDFSLANMLTQKRAMNDGKPLTPEQEAEVSTQQQNITARQLALDAYETSPKSEAYRKRLKGLIEQTKAKTEAGDFSKQKRGSITLDRDHLALQADLQKAKAEFWKGLQKDRLAKRGINEKVQDALTKWRRAFVLSSPTTLAKLTSAAAERMAFTPTENIVGGALSKIPGISQVMKRAPIEGGLSAKAEATALTEGFTRGMKDSWDTLRSGQTDLDLVYGPKNVLPKEAVNFMGQIHGALKAPVKRNHFARAFETLMEKGIVSGVDVTDPLVQTRYGVQAYKEANRSIFMQDSRVVNFYKRALSALDQPSKVTGKVPPGSKIAGTAARILFPIVKVPTNIVAETMQYSIGTITGSARLANAFRTGISKLPPEHADLIARELKKGSVGSAVMLLGYLNADKIGGYYQRGQKRKEGNVGFGQIKLFGHNIPPYLIHNPLLEQLQIGATIRRVAESKLRKKDTGPQGIPTGVLAAGLGVSEEVPFVRETLGELPKLFNPSERPQFLGEFSKSLAVPAVVQWAAQQMDKRDGEPVKRQADTILENIETGIPGLRSGLKEKQSRSRTPKAPLLGAPAQ